MPSSETLLNQADSFRLSTQHSGVAGGNDSTSSKNRITVAQSVTLDQPNIREILRHRKITQAVKKTDILGQ